jgi:hypothetical protein
MNVAPERHGPWALGAEATLAMMWVAHMMLRACAFIPPPPAGLMAHRGFEASTQIALRKMGQDLGRRGCGTQRGEFRSGHLLASLGAAWA